MDGNTSHQTPPPPPPRQYMEPSGLQAVRILVEIAIGLFGVGGNIIVCIAIVTRKRLKNTGNIFVFNLAIADLGVLLVCLPLVIIHADFPYAWPFGRVVCRILYPFTDIFYGVSIGSIVAISFHRYRMIVHCMEAQLTRKKAKILLLVIWFISYLLFVLPVNLVMDVKKVDGKVTCVAVWPKVIHRQLYVTFVSVFFYILPLVIILGTYLRIRHKLKGDSFLTSQMRDHRGTNNTIKTRLQQNRKALNLLTPVVIAFAALMFPINAIRLYAAFHQRHGATFPYLRLLYNLSVLLLLANSSINCVIYAVVNKDFRREFQRLLRCNSLMKLYRSLTNNYHHHHHHHEGDSTMFHGHSHHDQKTTEEVISHHDHSHMLKHNGTTTTTSTNHEACTSSDQAQHKPWLTKALQQHEVKDLLSHRDYENSVQYCTHNDNLTIVVK